MPRRNKSRGGTARGGTARGGAARGGTARGGAARGGAAAWPLSYFSPTAVTPSSGAGINLLGAASSIVRPAIKTTGGKRSKRNTSKSRRLRRIRKTRKTRGGFVPSIMGNFVAAASKFIVPIALYSGYKLLSRKSKPRRKTR